MQEKNFTRFINPANNKRSRTVKNISNINFAGTVLINKRDVAEKIAALDERMMPDTIKNLKHFKENIENNTPDDLTYFVDLYAARADKTPYGKRLNLIVTEGSTYRRYKNSHDVSWRLNVNRSEQCDSREEVWQNVFKPVSDKIIKDSYELNLFSPNYKQKELSEMHPDIARTLQLMG